MRPAVIDRQCELVVDVDGTLVKTDLLWESFFALLGRSPLRAVLVAMSLAKGKAAFKRHLAQEFPVVPDGLPYRKSVMSEVQQARAQGRTVVLATAEDEDYAKAIADSLGLFDRILASDGSANLSGRQKLEAICRTGSGIFDYIGDSIADLPIWRLAKGSLVVNPSAGLLRALQREGIDFRILDDSASSSKLRIAFQAMRPQQWIKNVLVFVPLVMAQRLLDWTAVASASFTFVALSLAASGTYILNDLMDIHSDRVHPRKRHRPFACGALSIPVGAALVVALIASGIATGTLVGVTATVGVALYVIMALTYSSILKTKVLADVLALASLYVYRILLGGAVTGVMVSHWLAVFSAFLFLSLALSKRASELMEAQQFGRVNARRGYRTGDLQLVTSLGVTSGVAAVLVFCLYISGETAVVLYHSPNWLWLASPALFYWIMRIWFLTERGELNDDPLVFAMRDRHTYVIGAVIVTSFTLAAFMP